MRKPLGRALMSCLLAGLSASASAAAPVATNDAYQTPMRAALVVNAPGVLGNDTDADGDTLTAAKTSDPLSGTLTFQATGAFTYTPDSDFYGTDSFGYEASDGSTTSSAVVSLTVPYNPAYGGGGSGGGYGSGGALAPALLVLLAVLALYPRGLKASKRRAISP